MRLLLVRGIDGPNDENYIVGTSGDSVSASVPRQFRGKVGGVVRGLVLQGNSAAFEGKKMHDNHLRIFCGYGCWEAGRSRERGIYIYTHTYIWMCIRSQ